MKKFAVLLGCFFLASLISFIFAQEQVTSSFKVLSLEDILSFLIKLLFTGAFLTALYFMFMGAFKWISSGGDEEAIKNARQQIQSSVIGLIIIFVVIAIAVTLEKFVFQENICFGFSCNIKLPKLRQTDNQVIHQDSQESYQGFQQYPNALQRQLENQGN
ncbi:MAG: hypothetical protein KatS3mg091_708 [Patescibacteria group bacterium]|nr:MAG: hypothetical protein KatS3mg091_708 [Patescibacteria group bacterium]